MQSNNSNINGVTLFLKAEGLSNVAGMFKGISDPYANLTAISYKGHDEIHLGTTEVIKNNLNPEWVTSFPLEYDLETNFQIVVEIFDKVSKKTGKDVSMGSVLFDFNELYNSEGKTMAVAVCLKEGKVIARVENIQGSGSLRLKLRGTKLKNIEGGIFGISDPFFEIKRKNMYLSDSIEWNTVYRSHTVKDNLNPDWEEDTMSLSVLCGGDLDVPLLFTVFDQESDGKHDPMGKIGMTVNMLVNMVGHEGLALHVIDMKGKDVGKITVQTAVLSGIEM